MSVNGKRDDFELDDLIAFGKTEGLKPTKAKKMIESISSTVSQWMEFADECGVEEKKAKQIALTHRTTIVK